MNKELLKKIARGPHPATRERLPPPPSHEEAMNKELLKKITPEDTYVYAERFVGSPNYRLHVHRNKTWYFGYISDEFVRERDAESCRKSVLSIVRLDDEFPRRCEAQRNTLIDLLDLITLTREWRLEFLTRMGLDPTDDGSKFIRHPSDEIRSVEVLQSMVTEHIEKQQAEIERRKKFISDMHDCLEDRIPEFVSKVWKPEEWGTKSSDEKQADIQRNKETRTPPSMSLMSPLTSPVETAPVKAPVGMGCMGFYKVPDGPGFVQNPDGTLIPISRCECGAAKSNTPHSKWCPAREVS